MTAPGGRPPRLPRRPPEPPLADEVVLLRLPGEADAPAIAAACGDAEIARWVPVPVPYTPADARAFIEGVGDGWAAGTDLAFAIEERASGALAGMIGLHPGGAPGRAAVGYWLAPDARGRGLATRAVRLLAAWAFADPALERLELLTLVGNEASGRVALRAGFRREGILRRYLSFRGAKVDAVMHARLRDDTPAGGEDGGRRAAVADGGRRPAPDDPYLDRGSLQRIDVTAGIESTLVILRSRWKAGIEVRRAYAPGLPRIEARGSELNQVWTNLLANAIDAMGGRGTLEIAAVAGPDGGVAVEVRDSGPGIPAALRGRIFDPFFTTKDVGAGTGLGLHISRSIAERHGGRLELASGDPGRTTFRVTLPPSPPAAPPVAPPGSPGGH